MLKSGTEILNLILKPGKSSTIKERIRYNKQKEELKKNQKTIFVRAHISKMKGPNENRTINNNLHNNGPKLKNS